MNEFDERLLAMFNQAKSLFFTKEERNILNDVAERNLCGRLSTYLENLLAKYELTGYYSDPEYNRQQNGRVKTILDENTEIVTICCDIIVHSRGEIVADDNLIAIEMKKSVRPDVEKQNDRKRLRALTKASYDGVWSADGITLPEYVCGYHIGIYMELDLPTRVCLFELYQHGEMIGEWQETF